MDEVRNVRLLGLSMDRPAAYLKRVRQQHNRTHLSGVGATLRLNAIVHLRLPELVLFEAPQDGAPGKKFTRGPYHFQIEEYDVTIWLRHSATFSLRLKDELVGVTGGGQLKVCVSRDEPEAPPAKLAEVQRTPRIGPLSAYALKKQSQYGKIAKRAVRQVLNYFRYVKGNPLIGPDLRLPLQELANPKLVLDDGEVVWDSVSTAVSYGIACVREYPRWGISPFRDEDGVQLEAFLTSVSDLPVYEEVRADARDAIARGDLRRGIVDLAIAAELALKTLLLPDSPAADVWVYFEQEGRLRLGVFDLLKAGEHLAGSKFGAAEQLRTLFSCRDQIVHHAHLRYRVNAQWVAVSRQAVTDWWDAVEQLLEWLHTVHAGRSNL